jgi:hypothetical protein
VWFLRSIRFPGPRPTGRARSHASGCLRVRVAWLCDGSAEHDSAAEPLARRVEELVQCRLLLRPPDQASHGSKARAVPEACRRASNGAPSCDDGWLPGLHSARWRSPLRIRSIRGSSPSERMSSPAPPSPKRRRSTTTTAARTPSSTPCGTTSPPRSPRKHRSPVYASGWAKPARST